MVFGRKLMTIRKVAMSCETICLSKAQFCQLCQVPDSSPAARQFEELFIEEGRALALVFRNGQLYHFLPIVNENYENKWHKDVTIEKNLTPLQLLEASSREGGYRFRDYFRYFPHLVNWRANGPLVRGDKKFPRIVWAAKPFIEQLRNIKNCIVFINTKDFPQTKYAIGNMCWPNDLSTPNWLIPTWDDLKPIDIVLTEWNLRKPYAVWRGSSTGDGRRYQLVKMSKSGLLDAGLTKWNVRPRIIDGVVTFNKKDVEIEICAKCSIEEQASHAKYGVCIDGNVAAFRLRHLFAVEFVVLFVESRWRIWYSSMLKPWCHFVPVAADLSDLIEKIEWCQKNDEAAWEIARNGRKFFEEHLSCKAVRGFFEAQINKHALF